MAIDQTTRAATALFIERLAATYDVGDAILFGSRARGDHTAESDADLAVVLKSAMPSRQATAAAMADIAFDVLLETGVLISPLPITEDEYREPQTFGRPAVIEAILSEGVRL
ncbi:MAG: nucleotidyltransferase domain-containing protein [Beijerinckiaceae bacterium]